MRSDGDTGAAFSCQQPFRQLEGQVGGVTGHDQRQVSRDMRYAAQNTRQRSLEVLKDIADAGITQCIVTRVRSVSANHDVVDTGPDLLDHMMNQRTACMIHPRLVPVIHS